MPLYTPKKFITSITLIIFVICAVGLIFAQDPVQNKSSNQGNFTPNNAKEVQKDSAENYAKFVKQQQKAQAQEEKDLSLIQKTAREYRRQGLDKQHQGDLESALGYYQKAISLDPNYAVAYNDLGIIYETMNMPERAEYCYLHAVKIRPNYLSSYTNLALFYENNRDLAKAAYYWSKRADLGSIGDPWVAKARKRFEDIQLVTGQKKLSDLKEEQTISLMKDVVVKKEVLKADEKALAKDYFSKAKLQYKKGYEVEALKLAIEAQLLDSSNKQVGDFIEKLQRRLLSK